MFVSLRAVIAVAALVSQVLAIPKVTRTGRYLYQEDGTRFYIKGIGYQKQGEIRESEENVFLEPSTFIDPLADTAGCTRDAPILQEAGVNTIRVYSVDFQLDHDACMKLFGDAGIYAILDLSLPRNGSIVRVDPSWSTNLLGLYIDTIDAFNKYDNVIAYNIGNEVINSTSTTHVAPYLKAAARDTKAYLKSIDSTALVGYAAINGQPAFRKALADFLSCGSDDSAIDLYGLNEYSWCGDSSFTDSGYSSAASQFADYNVVAYFSEYGCITNPPHIWSEVNSLFSSDMSNAWSGGIAFSYFPVRSAGGNFGLVTLSSDERTVTVTPEFTALSERYNAVTGPNIPSQASVAASVYPSCIATVGRDFTASNTLPATPNESACNCLQDALSCRYTPTIADYADHVGALLDSACSFLGGAGGTCNDIGGSGLTGTYGRLSACDPTVKLSYIMSQYYETQARVASACSFGGNGTVNAAASTTISAQALASSCIANPTATFVPSAGINPTGTGSNSGNAPNGSASAKSAAVILIWSPGALLTAGFMVIMAVISAI